MSDANGDRIAREVAAIGWADQEVLSPVHLGLNRYTWRVGRTLWLTGIDEGRADLLRREHLLLAALQSASAESGLRIEVPRVVPTTGGDDVMLHAGRAFRATAHIDGVRADDNRVDTFVASARTLRDLHAMLREVPTDLAVLRGALAEVSELLAFCLSGSWEPVTDDETERALVSGMAEWLAPRLARLEEAPAQLVHGDWAIPNLLFDASVDGTVVAVLDWQLGSVGPVMADVAQAVAGVLMFSELPTASVVDAIFDAYGSGADRRLLGPALAAYWFRNYWWLRDELHRDERHRVGVQRQPQRLRSVMAYVETLAD